MKTKAAAIKRKVSSKLASWWQRYRPGRSKAECNALYRLLYQLMHDKEQALALSALQTQEAFSTQWKDLPQGNALLSDPWFKSHVDKILCEEELLLKPEWFAGKHVLDAGCGNGRWSYGFAKLGASVTAVDINTSALEATKKALQEFETPKNFVHSALETLDKLPLNAYDLVFSWGVIHHCQSFNKALDQLLKRVKEGGIIYLYLYGRESFSFDADLELFKERVIYNTLPTWNEKLQFLMEKSGGDRNRLHINHDIYAPLINRRLQFDEVRAVLSAQGFSHIERTIDHTELFIRAVKGPKNIDQQWVLPKKKPPFWFERY